MHNTAIGQDAPEDPNATTQQQEAQFSTLSNLAQLVSGSMPENAVDVAAQPADQAQITAHNQGKSGRRICFMQYRDIFR